jgi:hypothetical protein
MKRLIVISISMLSAALFFFSPARADQITAIQVTPASPQQGSLVTVKLQGTGNCKTLELDWGDNTAHYFSTPPNQNYALPWTIPNAHTYQNPGGDTIKVVSVKGCQGTGLTKTITVVKKMASGGGIINLCATINCAALLAPQIDKFNSFSNFTPGGGLTVFGSGFGNTPGQLHMVGTTAGSFKITDTVVPLFQGVWTNKWISGTIPNLTGVVDQPVKFYVVTAGNLKSNDSPTVNFTAARETKQLTYKDPAVKLIACGTDSNADYCNGWIDPDDGGAAFYLLGDPEFDLVAFAGSHQNCPGCVGDDVGADTYQVQLANGWVLDQMVFIPLPSETGEADAKLIWPFPAGASSWQTSINWLATSGDSIMYFVVLLISGPKGVPIN